jgi:endonuclease YncB( thermonuclease family)
MKPPEQRQGSSALRGAQFCLEAATRRIRQAERGPVRCGPDRVPGEVAEVPMTRARGVSVHAMYGIVLGTVRPRRYTAAPYPTV